jgi:hypothetical protein
VIQKSLCAFERKECWKWFVAPCVGRHTRGGTSDLCACTRNYESLPLFNIWYYEKSTGTFESPCIKCIILVYIGSMAKALDITIIVKYCFKLHYIILNYIGLIQNVLINWLPLAGWNLHLSEQFIVQSTLLIFRRILRKFYSKCNVITTALLNISLTCFVLKFLEAPAVRNMICHWADLQKGVFFLQPLVHVRTIIKTLKWGL